MALDKQVAFQFPFPLDRAGDTILVKRNKTIYIPTKRQLLVIPLNMQVGQKEGGGDTGIAMVPKVIIFYLIGWRAALHFPGEEVGGYEEKRKVIFETVLCARDLAERLTIIVFSTLDNPIR